MVDPSRPRAAGHAELDSVARDNPTRTLSTNTMTRLVALTSFVIASSCSGGQTPDSGPQPCSEQWQQHVETQLQTGDAEGHGPDIGSLEWRSVVEFKLGIRGDPAIPSRESAEWCEFIDKKIRKPGT